MSAAHHATEPANTPRTTLIAPAGPPVPAPMLANSAPNQRMVAGFASEGDHRPHDSERRN